MKPVLLLTGLYLAFASTGLVGGDRDEHGCIGSAGYTWCEKLGNCARSWELKGEWDEVCTSKIPDGSPSEEGSQENISSDGINSSSEQDADENSAVKNGSLENNSTSKQNSLNNDDKDGSNSEDRMSSSENGSGSKDKLSSERASSEDSGASNSSDENDKKTTARVWFYEFLSVAIFLVICVPICVFLVERKRLQEHRRKAVMVQMLAHDHHNANALNYVETVAVKETEMTTGVDYERFRNVV